ncbi:hypothetical protein PPL_08923 [Heterostelium album PN500]|uniref:Uncharacterized protein n=1 Tax=Heterostelium pallidum (strain ATCC 26659 / Pp 5 / PN500) TaxID=670386 RepID=D3BK42_HETP5|nr:hypothetical protein PPL_08923 [Heterostelium album PN500]EFA78272.1 hypothetical protein PPL_08923 [Heterostelium album PN500]|eukprot:XP_020430397.1 hypothetical protein PPL_08923 [Heterostelium album PN500]
MRQWLMLVLLVMSCVVWVMDVFTLLPDNTSGAVTVQECRANNRALPLFAPIGAVAIVHISFKTPKFCLCFGN